MSLLRAMLLVLLLGGVAHADEPSPLGQAKVAFDQVRFDEAQRLLIEALEEGGKQPLAMREIYKLLGASAVALGKTDDAEKYYRTWLALDPTAALEAGASPKLRAPFDAAKSYITANGPLDVVAEYVSDSEVRARVISDPLALARSVRVGERSFPIVDRAALVPSTARAPLFVVDRWGNVLVEVLAPGVPPLADSPADPPPVGSLGGGPVANGTGPFVVDIRPRRSTAFYALAIPTGILLATGAGFGAAAFVFNNKVQDALDDSGAYYYSDVADDQKKVTLFWKLSAAIGGAGLVLAIPTAIVYLRDRGAAVTPFADGGARGVAISGRF
ncbi:MAG: tetratricopeptide repeat protein [Kofleriaceae bacterium]